MQRLRKLFKNPFKRKPKDTLKMMTPEEEDALVKKTIERYEGTVKPSKPAKKKKKKVKKCGKCGEELPEGYPMKLCTTCAREEYSSFVIKEPPPFDDKYAKTERDSKGRLTIKSIDIGAKDHFRRNVIAGVVILLVVCSGLTFAVNNWPEPAGGNPDWNTLSEYFVVNAWMAKTDKMSEHVLSAMTLWIYNTTGNSSVWQQVVEHSYNDMQKNHYFGRVPLGTWVTIRASLEWGNWSVAAGFPRALMLNSTHGSDEVQWYFYDYTITMTIEGSDGP